MLCLNLIMKTFTLALLLVGLTVSQTMKEVELSDTGEKTAEEVQASLECVKDSKWNDFFNTNLPDLGLAFIRDQLSKGASANKKYYVQVNETHNVMYFKEGNNYFIHLNEIGDDGSDVLLMRSFLQDNFQNCIQLLPDSCKWNGQREVKYIEVCEKGIELSEGFTQDFFKIALDETQGQLNPVDVVKALRDCYQPNVYSVAYKCYADGLYFDPSQAADYLRGVEKDLAAKGFETKLNLETMTIEYTRTYIEVNGEKVPVGDEAAA